MNKLFVILFLLASLSSCSSFQYAPLYMADNMKGYKCQGQVWDQATIDDMFNYVEKKDDQNKYEALTGYSECTHKRINEDTMESVCLKPVVYKSFMSKKKAECDKFLVDNKLL